MGDLNKNGSPSPLSELEAWLRAIVREEVRAAIPQASTELLTPEQLAEKISVPLSWVYEQSRQGNIPTHRLGRYVRFNLAEVTESQKKKS